MKIPHTTFPLISSKHVSLSVRGLSPSRSKEESAANQRIETAGLHFKQLQMHMGSNPKISIQFPSNQHPERPSCVKHLEFEAMDPASAHPTCDGRFFNSCDIFMTSVKGAKVSVLLLELTDKMVSRLHTPLQSRGSYQMWVNSRCWHLSD